jgi:UDP-glucuronate 4-epimerase
MTKTNILVTGTAGFIGFHLTRRLLELGYQVAGLDNLNDYYDVNLKLDRLSQLGINKQLAVTRHPSPVTKLTANLRQPPATDLVFYKTDLLDRAAVNEVFESEQPGIVVHLAAQAGVRYSLENPYAYIDSNISGFMNILEACRHHAVKHLVFASSSSVYGLNEVLPFRTGDNVDHPISLYAATKKANELMAHTYSHLYRIPSTGLRFFTVYGPWGRPDMALFLFTKAILEGRPIKVYNNGDMLRDFTYIDDIVEGIARVMEHAPEGNSKWDASHPDPASSLAPYRLYNIGNNNPVKLMEFIEAIEEALGRKAVRQFLPLQPGDVPATYADVSGLVKDFGYKPSTPLREGIRKFVSWYLDYYGGSL